MIVRPPPTTDKPVPVGDPYQNRATRRWYQNTDLGPVEIEAPSEAVRNILSAPPKVEVIA